MKMTMKKHSVWTLLLLLAFSLPTFAKTTNPVEFIVDGGYTYYIGVSQTTQLFVDQARKKSSDNLAFWVRVVDNPGVHPQPDEGHVDPPIRVYIKHFPIERYREIRRALKRIETFGVVNPYIEGAVICDAPNSTIRFRKNTVFIAYNCGADAPDADEATFEAESLLRALQFETVTTPDLQ